MATNFWTKITPAGVKANFMDALASTPKVYAKHCMEIPSDAPSETYAWLGSLPQPRRKLDGRNFQSLNEYSQTIENYTYELSVLVDSDSMMDDRHSMFQARIAEIAERWAGYHDSVFGALLIAGETATTTFDGTTFHDDTRTIGGSGTIDNSRTIDATDHTALTVAEFQAGLQECETTMWRFADDKGVPGFNRAAMSRMAVVIPPEWKRVATETLQSDIIGTNSNPWGKNLMEADVLLDLTTTDYAMYVSALGGQRMPFVYQQRSSLEIAVLNSANEIALNDGVMILCKQRFRMGYAEPRRNCRLDYT